MADQLRWGIIATGGIARQFASGLKVSKTGTLQAVGSRSIESATKFTDQFGGKPYASYEEVFADPEVDVVYIATPHHMHMDNTIAAARAGKGILCEKPFTLNSLEAERALAAVKEHGVFFMEAFMYRCAPQTIKVRELIAEGAIGQVRAINAEFSFHAGRQWDNFRADQALGGGGLMDVGAYAVSFSRLAAGSEPIRAHYVANLETGYDAYGSGCLLFPGGITAHIGSGVHLNMANRALVYGETGRIEVDQPWKCGGGQIHLYRNGQPTETFDLSISNDQLYAYEADAVAEYFEKGECAHNTIADTVGNMRVLDLLRESAGLTFAAELKA